MRQLIKVKSPAGLDGRYSMDLVFVSENINYSGGKKRLWALLHVNTNAAFHLNYLTSITSYNLF